MPIASWKTASKTAIYPTPVMLIAGYIVATVKSNHSHRKVVFVLTALSSLNSIYVK